MYVLLQSGGPQPPRQRLIPHLSGANPVMKRRAFPVVELIFFLLISGRCGTSQSVSSSNGARDAALPFGALTASRPVLPRSFKPFSMVGIGLYVGVGGLGFDVATPLSRKLNIRAGAEFFGYSTTFEDQGASVAVNFRTQSGHASLDWFPLGGRFRLSPLVVFANTNRVQATALVPAGSTITLNGQDYISSSTDPLRGAGSIDFRKASPGFSLGLGNIVPRTDGHFSFPIEAGCEVGCDPITAGAGMWRSTLFSVHFLACDT